MSKKCYACGTKDHDQLQIIANCLMLPVLVLDSSLRLVQFNKYAEDVLQLSPAKHLGQDANKLFGWLTGHLDPGESGPIDFKCVVPTIEGDSHAAVRIAPVTADQRSGYIITLHDITELKWVETKLRQAQRHLQDIIEFLPDPTFAIDNDGKVTIWNRALELLTGIPKETMLGQGNLAHGIPFWGERRATLADLVLWGGLSQYVDGPYQELAWEGESMFAECFVPTLNRGQGAYVWLKAAPFCDQSGQITGAIETVRDITGQRKAFLARQASEQRLRHITDNLMDIVCEMDADGTILYCSQSAIGVLGYTADELLGRSAFDLIHPDDLPALRQALLNIRGPGERHHHCRVEFRCRNVQGAYFWAEAVTNTILNEQGELRQILLALRNISARKALEEKLTFMSWHDSLTGLHNRAYWQRQLDEIEAGEVNPVGLLLCDVDGLKLVNDTMGHAAGDTLLIKLAEILSRTCNESEMVARVGGDEFAMLLPHTDRGRVLAISQAVQQKIDEYNANNQALPLSVSIGIAIRINPQEPLAALVKRADDRMYREKLNRSHSVRNSLVQALSLALEARDFGTEGHTQRVQQLATQLASALGMPGPSLNDLSLLAQFHDIGKVGTPDYILHKPGPLTEVERQEIQRHPEIGNRIALTSPDLAPIADLILKHHEWWNGAGYPLGLKGKEIPLACRILAVVDAYDAMTSDRPYRKAMPRADALAELKHYAGTQFDPQLVPVFVKLVRQN